MPKYCVFFIALSLPVVVRTICLVDNFEKFSMLLGFSRYVLERWARVCCVNVFLVRYVIAEKTFVFYLSSIVIVSFIDKERKYNTRHSFVSKKYDWIWHIIISRFKYVGGRIHP